MTRGGSALKLVQATALSACLISSACNRMDSGASTGPRSFDSPDAAAQAIYAAAKADDSDALLAIFGAAAKDFLLSGDAAQDRKSFDAFATAYDRMHRWGKLEGGDRVLIIGISNYPFPFPLRKEADRRWAFDAEGGRQEFLARRIGENELNVLGVLSAMASAQAEYYNSPREDSLQEYAQKVSSSPGANDGLYWPAVSGAPQSPLGPLIAQATREAGSNNAVPFYGYYFGVLTAQGPHANGGARNYVDDGHMTGGFAFVAYPAEYRKTGVMTFMVNQDGELFQKDLGPETAQVAERLASFDPDPSWSAVQ